MGQFLIIGISAAAGAGVLGFVAENNTLLGMAMGGVLGSAAAIAVLAFPTDLDYRERRFGPPRERL